MKNNGLEQNSFQKKLHNGLLINVTPQEHIQRQLFWYGFYEKKFILTWENFIQKDSVVIDIGANIGYYSLIASKKAAGGKVYSFEPFSGSYHLLKKNIELNHIQNIFPFQLAISNQRDEKILFISDPENSGMTGFTQAENFAGETEIATAVALEQWVKVHDLKKIDFIKIDIEGSEYDSLLGMKSVLQVFKPVLFIEVSDMLLQRFNHDFKDLYNFLQVYGYKPFFIEKPNILKPLLSPAQDELIVFLPKNYSLPEAIQLVEK